MRKQRFYASSSVSEGLPGQVPRLLRILARPDALAQGGRRREPCDPLPAFPDEFQANFRARWISTARPQPMTRSPQVRLMIRMAFSSTLAWNRPTTVVRASHQAVEPATTPPTTKLAW